MRQAPAILVLFVCGLVSGCGTSVKSDGPGGEVPRAATRPSPPNPDNRPVIVAFGDSLTAGLGVEPSENYPAKLQGKLDAAGFRYRVVNEGVSGETSAQGVTRLPGVRRLHPAIVILELGANDGLRGLPVSETRKNLDQIITTLKSDGTKVVLAGMQMPPNYGPDYTRTFGGMYVELAKTRGAALIPFFLAGVGGQSDLNQEDGIHPTARGYDVVTGNVWKVLEPLLK